MTLLQRFQAKYVRDSESGCWVWTASCQPTGYGVLWNGVRAEQAHRISYRLFRGEILDGCEIDHLCRNRSCVNPAHLRAVPHRENMRVSDTIMGRNAAKIYCMRGHPLSGPNLRVTKAGTRQCRACVRMHVKNYKRRRRANG